MTNNECKPNKGIKMRMDLIRCLNRPLSVEVFILAFPFDQLTYFPFEWFGRYSIDISSREDEPNRERCRNSSTDKRHRERRKNNRNMSCDLLRANRLSDSSDDP